MEMLQLFYSFELRLRHTTFSFHQLGPLGRVGLVVTMSLGMYVRLEFFPRTLIGPQIT